MWAGVFERGAIKVPMFCRTSPRFYLSAEAPFLLCIYWITIE
jgi:hypothetical protein